MSARFADLVRKPAQSRWAQEVQVTPIGSRSCGHLLNKPIPLL
jgi:hypothetical protein